MNKNLWIIFCVVILLLTIGSASAENISKWGVTQDNRGWLTGTKSFAPFLNNWTSLGESDNAPLVFDINNDTYNEVIQNRNGTIKVFSYSGTLITQLSLGVSVANRQMTAYDSDTCPTGNAIYITGSAPAHLFELCLDNNTLQVGWDCFQTLNTSSTTPDKFGASVSRFGLDILSVWFWTDQNSTNRIEVCDHTNQTSYSIINPSNGIAGEGVMPIGNPYNDGYKWVAYADSHQENYSNSSTIYLFNPINQTLNYFNITLPDGGLAWYLGDYNAYMPLFIQRGSGNPDDILQPYFRWFYTPSIFNIHYVDYWYGDATGYKYTDDFGGLGYPSYVQSYPSSYPVQLGNNGDICYFIAFNSYVKFYCRNPTTLVYTYTDSNPFANLVYLLDYKLFADDMNGDGYADFIIPSVVYGVEKGAICYYTNNTNPLSCNTTFNKSHYAYAVDIDKDGYRDLIESDKENNLLKVFLSSSATPVTFCSDTDVIPGHYPTLNFTAQGTMTATNLTPRTDYCSGNNTLYEYYCDDAQNYGATPSPHSCYADGKICQNGACVISNVSSGNVCTDSDSYIFPSINYGVFGIAVNYINGVPVSSFSDTCLSLTTLREYYCNTGANGTIVSTTLDCTTLNASCGGGSCVASQPTCLSYSDTSDYPNLWVETFGYIDPITNHGWYNYAWIPGVNYYDACNILFMNASKNLIPISKPSLYPYDSPISILTFDMGLDSTLLNGSIVPNGMPVSIEIDGNSTADIIIQVDWLTDGTIWAFNGGAYVQVGNWQTWDMYSYKIIINQDDRTFNFYYTNSSNMLSYITGGQNLSFIANHSLNFFQVNPHTPVSGSYASVGVFLDNIRLQVAPAENMSGQTNFCSMTNYGSNCVFFDHFDYADDTYAHGWYLFNTTTSNSIVTYDDPNNLYFQHEIGPIYSSSGVFTTQFRALFPAPPQNSLDTIYYRLYGPGGSTPVNIQFRQGRMYDMNQNGLPLGTYSYGVWYKVTMEIDPLAGTYDLYLDNKKLVNKMPIVNPSSQITKVYFFANTNSSIMLDYVSIIKSTILTDPFTSGIDSETGVPIADTTWCWSKTNGSFNWDCCTGQENATKSFWCPVRTTIRYGLGGVTNFVLMNFIYFLIIVIAFVLITPYIAPKLRGR